MQPRSSQSAQSIQQQFIPNYHNLDKEMQKHLLGVLQAVITFSKNKPSLQEICRSSNLEEAPLLRSHIWKLLLGTLEGDCENWQRTRQKNSQLYSALKAKFCSSYADEEDLLDLGPKNFDQQLWQQIVLDTKRTHASLNFFQSKVSFGKVYASKPTKHCDMLTRILYIWGKTNSTVRYVQGMNQILAPFYYLEFQSLESLDWDRESQVFFMFSALMSEIIDMHIKDMDDCQSGIMGRMNFLNKYLRVVDGELWKKMEIQNIYPQYYSFRWLALFLAQEFDLLETIRLWDFVFSYEGYCRFFFVYSLCIAILQFRKRVIMENDFVTSLPLIQKLKDLEIDSLIKNGTALFNKYKRSNIAQQFDALISKNSKEKELLESEVSERKHKYLNYAELLKSTGNYLSKWTAWTSK